MEAGKVITRAQVLQTFDKKRQLNSDESQRAISKTMRISDTLTISKQKRLLLISECFKANHH